MFEHLTWLACQVEANWCMAWASLGAVDAVPRTVVEDTPECLRVYTPGVHATLMNLVVRYRGARPDRAVALGDIERTLDPYRQHHLLTQWWVMRDAGEPPTLRDQLNAAGMRCVDGAPAMTLDLRDWRPRYFPAPAGATFARVATAQDAADALSVICAVYYVPGDAAPHWARWTTNNPAFTMYLARLGGQPAAALGILPVGAVAGVYHVATLPWARRRGLAGNLLLLALADARAAGCQLSTLTATPDARALYERLGYRAVGLLEQWLPGSRLARDLTGG